MRPFGIVSEGAGGGTRPVEVVDFVFPADIMMFAVYKFGFHVGWAGKEDVSHCGERTRGEDGDESCDGGEGRRTHG